MKFTIGTRVRKIKGSQWRGVIVGTYSTELTPEGYCVESELEKGSVQIYPASALVANHTTVEFRSSDVLGLENNDIIIK